jgi:DNA mismatch endonuclease (patch repair protein)
MLATRQRDTLAEMELRRALHRHGFRYRVDSAPVAALRTRADVVFTKARVAVFVDGCFWHSCPEHGSIPQTNRDWWITKLATNVARDRRASEQLREAGWVVLRCWEHDDMTRVAKKVISVVRARNQEATVSSSPQTPTRSSRRRS